jgi:hypothetical protein
MNVPFNAGEDSQARLRARQSQTVYPITEAHSGRSRSARGRTALEQARLILLVMLNVAQLWILAATLEAALAHNYKKLWPLATASGVCWLISLSIILWWKPASGRYTSTGYIREKR